MKKEYIDHDPMLSEELVGCVNRTVRRVLSLFARKHREYKGAEDALSNFTIGGLLLYPDKPVKEAQYEALKAYMAKHIAKIFEAPLETDVEENWADVIVYSCIAIAMKQRSVSKLEEAEDGEGD